MSNQLTGAELIAAERLRQISKEGWSARHDDNHHIKELSIAAASYLSTHNSPVYFEGSMICTARHDWPWSMEWWKPSQDPIRNLVKAGALIAAEIDRLQRDKKSQ